MLFFAGVLSKVKDLGMTGRCTCPVCGAQGAMRLTNTYLTPHIFLIPTVHLRSAFYLTCPSCASMMEIPKEVGEALRKNPDMTVPPSVMHILQNNRRLFCTGCGKPIVHNQRFCGNCGTPQRDNAP